MNANRKYSIGVCRDCGEEARMGPGILSALYAVWLPLRSPTRPPALSPDTERQAIV
jgi:hypothetical protein